MEASSKWVEECQESTGIELHFQVLGLRGLKSRDRALALMGGGGDHLARLTIV